jgi:hypothetical protein
MEKFPEQPASTTADARAASHGNETRAGRDMQAYCTRNMWAGLLGNARLCRLCAPAIGHFFRYWLTE